MKKILLVLTAFILLFAMAGCDNGTLSRVIPGAGKGAGADKSPDPYVLKVTLADNTESIDLALDFAKDDVITITGKILSFDVAGLTPRLYLNPDINADISALGDLIDLEEDTEFTFKYTLTAADIGVIGDAISFMADGAENVVLVIYQISVADADGTAKFDAAGLLKKFKEDLAEIVEDYELEDVDVDELLATALETDGLTFNTAEAAEVLLKSESEL
jgi:hypothetical protein